MLGLVRTSSPRTQKSMLIPAPPARSSSISSKSSSNTGGNHVSSQVARLPSSGMKPQRFSSVESSNESKIISSSKEREVYHPSNFPPPVDYLDGISRIKVVVEDPSYSDLDSSTCDSTTPIVRYSSSFPNISCIGNHFRRSRSREQKPGKVWPISQAPLLMQRGSSSAVAATSPGTNIQEICRKARNLSQSSSVDWSKLP